MSNEKPMNGVLVTLSLRLWGNRTKAKSDEYETEIPQEYISAVKRLIPRRYLEDLEKCRNETRSYLYSKTLPYPIRGVCVASLDILPDIIEGLEIRQQRFNDLVDELVAKYEKAYENAQEHLGPKHFEAHKYPAPGDLKNKCSFNWLVYDAPSCGDLKSFSTELYKKEQEKIKTQMEQAGRMMVMELMNRYMEFFKRITEKMTKEKKRFKSTAFQNFESFLTDMPKLAEITSDTTLKTQLKKLSSDTMKLVKGIDLESMKEDEHYRVDLGKQFKEIEKVATGMMEDIPVRSIKIVKKSKAKGTTKKKGKK